MRILFCRVVSVFFFFFAFSMTVLFGSGLVNEIYEAGISFYASGDYFSAVDYLGQVVDLQPQKHIARFYLIYSLKLTGREPEALMHAQRLHRDVPDDEVYKELYESLSQIVIQQPSRTSGSKYEAVTEKRTSFPRSTMVGGYDSLGEVRRPFVSTQTYDITPPAELTEVDRAVRKIDDNDYGNAKAKLQKILSSEPNNFQATHYMGVVKLNTHEYSKAIEWFHKALEINSDDFQTRFLVAACWRALNDTKKAEENFLKALEIRENVFARFNLAALYMQTEQFARAKNMYEIIIENDPNMIEAKIGIAEILHYEGYTQKAADLLAESMSRRRNNAHAHFVRARLLLESDLLEEALQEAAQAVNLAQNNNRFRAFYALTQARNNNYAQALEQAGVVVQSEPDNVQARLVMAEILIMSGMTRDAMAHIDFVKNIQEHPRINYLLAQSAISQNNNEEARSYFENYYRASPGQPKVAMKYAVFLESNNFKAQALRVYQDILNNFSDTDYAAAAIDGIDRLKDQDDIDESDSGRPQYRPGKVRY